MFRGYNWLEHIHWNPAGTRFAFLHRWRPKGDSSHATRLFTADANGTNVFMFPDSRFYSHMAWHNDKHLTIWALTNSSKNRTVSKFRRNPGLRSCIRPPVRLLRLCLGNASLNRFLPNGAFFDYEDQTHKATVVGENKLVQDGHNSWTRDKRWMLADTYQDKQNYRYLLLYDNAQNELHTLGRFYSPYNDSVYRYDLHPRFDLSEQYIIVDSAHAGPKRQTYILGHDRFS